VSDFGAKVSSLRHLPSFKSVKHGPFQVRLKFGEQAYCVIGEEAADVAKKLRELAAQVGARSK
jgi:hypothetical protein